jgi:hypothetical protein
MNRIVFGLSILGIVAIAAWAYGVNYQTGTALREVERLRSEIATVREDIQVLRVEWAYLNAPDRLGRLVAEHHAALGLEPIRPERFGRVQAVPFPPEEEVDPLAAALAAAASSILAQHAGLQEPVPEAEPELLPVVDGPVRRFSMAAGGVQ